MRVTPAKVAVEVVGGSPLVNFRLYCIGANLLNYVSNLYSLDQKKNDIACMQLEKLNEFLMLVLLNC